MIQNDLERISEKRWWFMEALHGDSMEIHRECSANTLDILMEAAAFHWTRELDNEKMMICRTSKW